MKEALHSLKGIVFDLDGTLVDSLTTTFDAFNHGIETHGGSRHTPQEIMKYFGTGEQQIFAQILGPDQAASAYAASRHYLDQNLHTVVLHEGVQDLLEKCKMRSVPVSIVTGRSWITTEVILKHHALLDRFITVVANDHVNQPKPSPEGIRLALQRMNLLPSEAIYVGDSTVDVKAARSAGSRAVAALWDLMASRSELAECDPHHWAEKPSDIWKIWEASQE